MRSPSGVGNDSRDIAPNGFWSSVDGVWVVLPASSPNMWRRLCAAIDRPELTDDPRFATNTERVAHRVELDHEIAAAFGRWPADELLGRLRAHDVAAGGTVSSMADVLAERRLWDNGSLVRIDDPDLGAAIAVPGLVPRLSRTPGEIRTVGPEPGQHSEEVLTELLGLTDEDCRQLARDGVIGRGREPSPRRTAEDPPPPGFGTSEALRQTEAALADAYALPEGVTAERVDAGGSLRSGWCPPAPPRAAASSTCTAAGTTEGPRAATSPWRRASPEPPAARPWCPTIGSRPSAPSPLRSTTPMPPSAGYGSRWASAATASPSLGTRPAAASPWPCSPTGATRTGACPRRSPSSRRGSISR